ncbi:MAG: tRNA (adenosine(37)-N6)-threonylcarbamoyltransferase complex dimerization subunit type 1 TsaB [Gemmatimonadota bacterium]|nr:tRNA (adenosine(37)-N6)-threonylcarbamoyltransferase complex dimerization subunit type 1 TsaB [Gemmatimonadota bacterium]
MHLTLALDASTYDGSVAVIHGASVLGTATIVMRDPNRERLMPAVAAALADAGVHIADVDRVVCGGGPGSFTSIRIAGAIAKGIASGRNVPMYAVSSLTLIVAGSVWSTEPGRYLAVLGAMRGDVFAAGLEVVEAGRIHVLREPAVLRAEETATAAQRIGARLIGPGQPLHAAPHARGVAVLGGDTGALVRVDVGSWEPDYGRLAEAQVRWEATHGRPLPA